MFKELFIHQLRQAIRHRSWDKQLATNIFLGILFTLLLINIITIGYAIDDILLTLFPDKDLVLQFASYILYYIIVDIILRLMIQNVPALTIKPYLTLPIKKKNLIFYLLSKTFWSFFPIIPMLVLIPFSIKILSDVYPIANIILWNVGLFIFFNFISFLALYLKRRIAFNPGILAVLILCFILLILLEKEDLINTSEISKQIFTSSLEKPVFNIIPVLLLISMYSINFYYLKRHAYTEEILPKRIFKKSFSNYQYLGKMGIFGHLLAHELRLISRNKRIRSTVFLSIWMIFLAFPFYKYYSPGLEKRPQFANYIQDETLLPGPDKHIVTFKVITDSQPPLKQVCITGDHIQLGEWEADLVPLQLIEDSIWIRQFIFENGTELKYKITGADWGYEALYEKDKIPDAFNLTVTQDTTINISVLAWNEDKVFSIMSGAMLIYASVFFIGMFIITHGQFMFAWEAGYFDFLMVQKIDYRKFLLVKISVLSVTCLVAFLMIAPFIFTRHLAFLSLLVALLYNLGINIPLMVFLSMYNRTRIDISAGAFSMQGKSGQQMINVLILILAPAIISAVMISNFGTEACFKVLGGLGLAGIVLFPVLFNHILKKFIAKKYIMGAAFRQPG